MIVFKIVFLKEEPAIAPPKCPMERRERRRANQIGLVCTGKACLALSIHVNYESLVSDRINSFFWHVTLLVGIQFVFMSALSICDN